MAMSKDKMTEARRLVQAGSLEQAEAICRSLLRNRPNSIDALQLLGGIHCRRAEYAEASEVFKKAAHVQPRDPNVFRNLGFALSSQGDPSAAVEAYQRAAELAPGDAQILNDLGMLFRTLNRNGEAIAHLEKAVSIAPDQVFPRRNLAELQLCQGRAKEAIASFEEVVRQAPEDPVAHNGLGNTFALTGNASEAIAAYERAIAIAPDFAEAENNLATLLRLTGKRDEAVDHCRRAVELRPDVPETHERLGQALMARGDLDEALVHSEAALKIKPGHVPALNNIGSILMDLGRFEESIAHFEKALSFEPNHILSLHNLSDLVNQGHYTFSDEQIKHVAAACESKTVRPDILLFAHFSYARILEKQKRYEEAFASYERANLIKQKSLEMAGMAFKPSEHTQQVDSLTAVFNRDFFESHEATGSDSKKPVFVVGMPRSGTTLVEQIIASHPQAAGAGELPDLAQIAMKPFHAGGIDHEFPHSVLEFNDDEFKARAQEYLDRLDGLAPGADRVVDKMWGNFANLGFIAKLFPQATIIHCRRDPMDIGLSCFLNNFSTIRWAWSLDDIAFYYREYERIVSHWQEVLPVTVHEVQYEDMVEEPEQTTRALIEHCGLEWNDQCLEFHKNETTVQTASRVQVRQPIYKSSRGRWRRYEEQLKPLREAIESVTNTSP